MERDDVLELVDVELLEREVDVDELELERDVLLLLLEELDPGFLFLKVTVAQVVAELTVTLPLAGITENCCHIGSGAISLIVWLPNAMFGNVTRSEFWFTRLSLLSRMNVKPLGTTGILVVPLDS